MLIFKRAQSSFMRSSMFLYCLHTHTCREPEKEPLLGLGTAWLGTCLGKLIPPDQRLFPLKQCLSILVGNTVYLVLGAGP